jgi:hypothetical protein
MTQFSYLKPHYVRLLLVGDLLSEHPRVAHAAVKHLKSFWSAGDESYDWPTLTPLYLHLD